MEGISLTRQSLNSLSHQTSSVEEITIQFTDRLCTLAEDMVAKRGGEIIEAIFPSVMGRSNVRSRSSATRNAVAEQHRLVAAFTVKMANIVEQAISARVRKLMADWLTGPVPASHVADVDAPLLKGPDLVPGEPRPRRHVLRRRPSPPQPTPRDPEEIKRDAELARLRTLLRPAVADVPPSTIVPTPATAAPLAKPQGHQTPGEFLRALEQEIMNAVPFLADFGPERCGAQIAVWAGLARELRDRLTPEVAATMRPAFRIFFEHLTQLRDHMETLVVDALEPTWTPPDWHSYVEVNRARVEGRNPEIPLDKVHVHHRTMLRALTLPHRRRAPEEVSAIITEAAAVLPASDPQLQSTVRRFGSLWKAPVTSLAPPPPADEGSQRNDESHVGPVDRKEPDIDFGQAWIK
jgi:hypothetical protein